MKMRVVGQEHWHDAEELTLKDMKSCPEDEWVLVKSSRYTFPKKGRAHNDNGPIIVVKFSNVTGKFHEYFHNRRVNYDTKDFIGWYCIYDEQDRINAMEEFKSKFDK